MEKLTLKISERVNLLKLLPTQGSRIEMVMCDSLSKIIDLTEEEVTQSGFSLRDGFFQWQTDFSREFEFSPEQLHLLKEGISQADRERRISREQLFTIDKLEALF